VQFIRGQGNKYLCAVGTTFRPAAVELKCYFHIPKDALEAQVGRSPFPPTRRRKEGKDERARLVKRIRMPTECNPHNTLYVCEQDQRQMNIDLLNGTSDSGPT
jgi:hypothetical protein